VYYFFYCATRNE